MAKEKELSPIKNANLTLQFWHDGEVPNFTITRNTNKRDKDFLNEIKLNSYCFASHLFNNGYIKDKQLKEFFSRFCEYYLFLVRNEKNEDSYIPLAPGVREE